MWHFPKQGLLERKEKKRKGRAYKTSHYCEQTVLRGNSGLLRFFWTLSIFETLQLFLIVLHRAWFLALIPYYEGVCVFIGASPAKTIWAFGAGAGALPLAAIFSLDWKAHCAVKAIIAAGARSSFTGLQTSTLRRNPTPSLCSLISAAKTVRGRVFALLRPNGGDWCTVISRINMLEKEIMMQIRLPIFKK